MNTGQNPQKWRRWVFLMGCSLFGLAAFSFFRLWHIGTPNLDGLHYTLSWEIIRRTILFFLLSGMGLAFFKLATQDLDETNLRKLLHYSLLLQFIAFLSLPLTSNDIFSNLAYGKMSHLGLNPDTLSAAALPITDPFRQMVTARWMNTPMVYGPVIGWLNYLATQPDSLWASIFVYKLFALLFSVAMTFIVYLYCRSYLTGPAKCSSFIIFVFNPVFIWELCSQAHNDALMVMGILFFVFFAATRREWKALLCLLFAFVTKLAVLPIIGLYLCYTFFDSRRRFVLFCLLLGMIGIFAAYYFSDKLALALVVPSGQQIDWLRLTNSPLYIVYRLLKPFSEGVQIFGYKIYWVSSMLFMAYLGFRFAWRCRKIDQFFLYTFLFMFLFYLIASPAYQPWYTAWLLPFAMMIKDKRLKNFFIIYSVVTVVQYFAQNSLFGSILNLCMLICFWFAYWRKTADRHPLSPVSTAWNAAV